MLVLSRKTGEKVMIGDDIEICIVKARDGNVIIGFNADKKHKIDREEIYIRKLKEDRMRMRA